jgi:NAD(P)-dependent dehydrogenase (short-subunit alcohol dehydrogenase family)
MRGRDITVNAVAPAPTATDLFLNGKSDMFADFVDEGVRPYSMALVDEVVHGGWGRADETVTLAKLSRQT